MLKLRLLVHLCLSQSWPKILKSFKMFPTWFSVLVSEIPILYNLLVLPHSFFLASRQLRAATSTNSRDCLDNVKEKQASIYNGLSYC